MRSVYGYEHIRYVARDEIRAMVATRDTTAAVSTPAPVTCTR